MDAWIEITETDAEIVFDDVASFMDAWIEIWN